MDLSVYLEMFKTMAVRYAGDIVLAIIVLLIGWWLINKITGYFERQMEKKDVDASLRPFLKSLTKITLRVLLLVSIASMVGIKTTSFVAIIGAAGLAIGLSLQGSLANFAGGVMILLLKPFKVGHFIEASGMSGTVTEIHIFYTHIKTTTNKEYVIPNGQLANSAIKNYSIYDTSRMDVDFKIGYATSIDKVKTALEQLIEKEEGLVKDPQFYVYVKELAENYMIVSVRAWLDADKYWGVVESLPEKVKIRFDEEGIQLPKSAIRVISEK